MKKQLGFHIDTQKCLGCYTCAMACKNVYHQPAQVLWRRIYHLDEAIYGYTSRAFYSLACNHCEKPACMDACPVGAYLKRESDGVVIHEQEKCIGCGNCIRACPFGAPQYNPVLKKAEKCSLCFKRLDEGLLPACVLSCPVDALELIDINRTKTANQVDRPEGFLKNTRTNPSVRFTLAKIPETIKRGDNES